MTVDLPAITLWEPYASLVVNRLKHVETRNWETARRGTFVVHAAAAKPVACPTPGRRHSWEIERDGDAWLARFPNSRLAIRLWPGHVVGTARLVDTRRAVAITPSDDTIGWALEADVLGYPTGRTLADPDELDVVGDLIGADRVGWLLDSAHKSTTLCPVCLGTGRADNRTPCPVCHGHGFCAPVPAKGRQGWWRWKP